jgi:hypothetical protein
VIILVALYFSADEHKNTKCKQYIMSLLGVCQNNSEREMAFSLHQSFNTSPLASDAKLPHDTIAMRNQTRVLTASGAK